MSSLPPPPRPQQAISCRPLFSGQTEKNAPWAWILLGVVLSVAVLSWFGHMVWKGYHQANLLAGELHEKMARRDWDGIYSEASASYRGERSADENKRLFAAIDRKLGAPTSTRVIKIFVSSNFSGTTVHAVFETQFANQSKAEETMSWTSLTGTFYLSSYQISSLDLVTR